MKPLEERVLGLYESLTAMERRLADVVLEHQRDIASYSATELARQANVSKATAARLFKRLGYKDYGEAKRHARAMRHWGSPLTVFEELDPRGSEPNLGIHLQNDITNLTLTFQRLQHDVVEAAIDVLAKAERIWVVGLRANHALAGCMDFWLKVLKSNVHFVPTSGLTFAEDLVDMRAGDAVVAVGFRRRSRLFRALLKKARHIGLRIILITDLSASATADLAHVVIRCHTRPSYLFDSYTAVMSVLNFLVAGLAIRLGVQTRARLQKIEMLHDELDAFTTPIGRHRRPNRKRSRATKARQAS